MALNFAQVIDRRGDGIRIRDLEDQYCYYMVSSRRRFVAKIRFRLPGQAARTSKRPGLMMLPTDMLVAIASPFMGSFVTTLAHRLPTGTPVTLARSACPACGEKRLDKQFSTFASGSGSSASTAAPAGGCGGGSGFT